MSFLLFQNEEEIQSQFSHQEYALWSRNLSSCAASSFIQDFFFPFSHLRHDLSFSLCSSLKTVVWLRNVSFFSSFFNPSISTQCLIYCIVANDCGDLFCAETCAVNKMVHSMNWWTLRFSRISIPHELCCFDIPPKNVSRFSLSCVMYIKKANFSSVDRLNPSQHSIRQWVLCTRGVPTKRL